MENSIIFGPIISRRFGVSLGIDLSVNFKQCNFDCLYCELQKAKTVNKQEDVIAVDTIIDELKKHLDDKIDVITLTANGEPTLYPYLDELIDKIDKIKNRSKTLILTNSATLSDNKIFNTLLKLDKVKLSLDAVSEDIFKKIDRPHKSIDISKIATNIIKFSKLHNKELYIEILFVDGINDKDSEIEKLNSVLKNIKATRIDLGTIDRPPAYGVKPISYDRLYEISLKFDSRLPIHIASRGKNKVVEKSYSKDEILTTLLRRPLTQDDIDTLFDQSTKNSFIELLKEEKIVKKNIGGIDFFVLKD